MDDMCCDSGHREGYLTNAITQMEQLIDQLDGSNRRSAAIAHLHLSSRDSRVDSLSGDESTPGVRTSPHSDFSIRTCPALSSDHISNRLSTLTANLSVSKEEMRTLLRSNSALRQKNIALSRQAQESEEKYNSLKNRLRIVRQELHKKIAANSNSGNVLSTPQVPSSACKDNDVAV